MKKLVAISIMAAMLLAIGAVAMASETDWLLLMKAQSSAGTLASGVAQMGTATGALDTQEAKDGNVVFSAGNAGLGIYEPTWTGATPALYGKDCRAPFTGTETKSWDLVLFVGTSYAATDLQLFWWNGTAATQDMPLSFGGAAYNYTVTVVHDPTGTYADGFVAGAMDGSANGGATYATGLGKLSWTSIASIKTDPTSAIQSGIQLRFTATPAGVQPPVPEPSSMLALASGLVGLAGYALRRRA